MKKYNFKQIGIVALVLLSMVLSAEPLIFAQELKSEIKRAKTLTGKKKKYFTLKENKRHSFLKKSEKKTPSFAPGQVLVKFKEGADPQQALRQINLEPKAIERIYSIVPAAEKFKKGYKLEKSSEGWYWFLGKQYKEANEIPDETAFKEAYKGMAPEEKSLYRTYKIILPEGRGVGEIVEQLKSHAQVEYAQPNYLNKAYMAPNDPYYSSKKSWGQPYDDLWGLKKIACGQAWDISQGEDVVVAVIDTGVDYIHEDLSANIWNNPSEIPNNGIDDDKNGYIDDVKGYDFSDNDPNPADYDGHGTHVSGTIAAVGNNAKGIIGVAPKAKIMGLKIFPEAYDDVCAIAIKYAADNGAKILSNSWGPDARCPSLPIIEEAIDYAHAKNCTVVFATGNDSDNVIYYSPANYIKVISVGAYDQNDIACFFSNYGSRMDVVAPGGNGEDDPYNILSLLAKDANPYYLDYKVGKNYLRLAGTSMACPHVSGLAALIASLHPEFTNEEIRQVIRTSADNVGSPGWDIFSGYGRINTYKALQIKSPCTAIISEVIRDKTNNSLKIIGTASGKNFSFYYLRLINYDTRELILEQKYNTPIVNSELGEISLNNVRDADYIIQLSAVNQDNQPFYSNKPFIMNNLKITTPTYTLFSLSGINYIEGESKFNYSITWGWGENPDSWSSEGIIIGGGEGKLGSLDGRKLPKEDGLVAIKIEDEIGNQEILRIVLSSNIKPGWPKTLPRLFVCGDEVTGSHNLNVADLNGDGLKEIITMGDGGDLTIFSPNGTILAEKNFPLPPCSPTYEPPLIIADLDGNGKPEIIFSRIDDCCFLYVVSLLPDNTIKQDRVIKVTELNFCQNFIAQDINHDGKKELLMSGFGINLDTVTVQHLMTVYDYTGKKMKGWPVRLIPQDIDFDFLIVEGWIGMPYLPLCAVGNLDNDPELEIVGVGRHTDCSTSSLYVTFFDPNGKAITGAPKLISEIERSSIPFTASPVIGDINGDGKNEVIIGSLNGVYALNQKGKILWVRKVSTSPEEYNTIERIALSDFNNDNNPEIICSLGQTHIDSPGGIFVFKGNGSLISSRTLPCDGNVAADVNRDENMEVVTMTNEYKEDEIEVYVTDLNFECWNPLTKKALYKKKVLRTLSYGNTLVADLDQDGTPELIAICSPDSDGSYDHLCVWELNNFPPGRLNSDWTMFQHDPQMTGLYPSKFGIPAPSTPIVSDGGREVHRADQLSASWACQDKKYGIAAYQYKISKDSEDGKTIIGWQSAGKNTKINVSNLNLANEKTYYFGVRAKNNAGVWSKTGYSDGITVILGPEAPSQLKGKITKTVKKPAPGVGGPRYYYESLIKLEWKDNSPNEKGFMLERKLEGGQEFKIIATIGHNETSYSDKLYWYQTVAKAYYRIRAYNEKGRSLYSNVISIPLK